MEWAHNKETVDKNIKRVAGVGKGPCAGLLIGPRPTFPGEVACEHLAHSPASCQGDFLGPRLLKSMSISCSKSWENGSTWKFGKRIPRPLFGYINISHCPIKAFGCGFKICPTKCHQLISTGRKMFKTRWEVKLLVTVPLESKYSFEEMLASYP